jgi:hypothetical protein
MLIPLKLTSPKGQRADRRSHPTPIYTQRRQISETGLNSG